VTLRPGEARRVRFAVDDRALSYWDERTGGWRVAPGCYRVMVGRSSRDLRLEGTIARGGARCADSVGLPPARRCLSRRNFNIRLRDPRPGERLVSARATIGRRRMKVVRRRGKLVIRVDLRGLPKGRYRLRVVARTSRRRTVRQSRTYRTCRPGDRRG
jgi:hypothetical protein